MGKCSVKKDALLGEFCHIISVHILGCTQLVNVSSYHAIATPLKFEDQFNGEQ